jgi:peroxiredoxin
MKFIFVFLSIVFTCTAQSKNFYTIKVQVPGVPDTMCYLANHFGDKQYLQDSCIADSKGNFEFKGEKKLSPGMYLIVLPNKRYFEIVLDQTFQFSVKADTTLNPSKIVFTGSVENTEFYSWLNYINDKRKEMEQVRVAYNALPETNKENSAEYQRLKSIETEIELYQQKQIDAKPESFLSVIFLATREVEIPDAPVLSNGLKDSTFQFYYYRNHYFDNVNFGDARLLRTPVFHQKLDYYMNKLVQQIPDSINIEADKLVALAQKDTEVFKYTVWYITHAFETSKIMGMDAVFCHMVKKYYTRDKAYWLDDASLYKIQERAKQLEPILLGKKARNLVLTDTSNFAQSLYAVNEPWTVLFFWDPDCGHCKKSMPKLIEFYNDWHKKGVQIFAVCNETEMDKWKAYIKENNLQWINVADPNLRDNFRYDFDVATTPQVFVLDKDKIIRAKKLDVSQLDDFLKHESGKLN